MLALERTAAILEAAAVRRPWQRLLKFSSLEQQQYAEPNPSCGSCIIPNGKKSSRVSYLRQKSCCGEWPSNCAASSDELYHGATKIVSRLFVLCFCHRACRLGGRRDSPGPGGTPEAPSVFQG